MGGGGGEGGPGNGGGEIELAPPITSAPRCKFTSAHRVVYPGLDALASEDEVGALYDVRIMSRTKLVFTLVYAPAASLLQILEPTVVL